MQCFDFAIVRKSALVRSAAPTRPFYPVPSPISLARSTGPEVRSSYISLFSHSLEGSSPCFVSGFFAFLLRFDRIVTRILRRWSLVFAGLETRTDFVALAKLTH